MLPNIVGPCNKVLIHEVDSSRILPNIYSSLGLQYQISPPHSGRYICEHCEVFLQSRGESIDLYKIFLLVILLLLVLFPERTLGTIVAKLTTPEAFDL